MKELQYRRVKLRFCLSDWTLFHITMPLQVKQETITDRNQPIELVNAPDTELIEGSQGFNLRGHAIKPGLPPISLVDDYICYIEQQFQHCSIDLGGTYEGYKQKFSSKTRSSLSRKIRKYRKHCSDEIDFRAYSTPDEMNEFISLAGQVSRMTYQEKLFDGGIPRSEKFISQAKLLAEEDCVRAYILFDNGSPVSYLYCPVEDGILLYTYLGYNPAYRNFSVGTVLQLLALETLFAENKFLYFDFTEGQSAHKKLFSTHQELCGNIFLLKRGLRNSITVRAHMYLNRTSNWLGNKLEHYNLKSKLRRVLRSV